MLGDSGLLQPPELDDNGRASAPEFARSGGSVFRTLCSDPDGPDGGGLSLVWARMGANYRQPRHSHGEDCLYYVVSGELTMGNRTVTAGEGFFVPGDAPYTYITGAEGVELLEFRGTSTVTSRNIETAAGWREILDGVRTHREQWAAELAPYR